MKVYLAQCHTMDPEIVCSERDANLGIFSSKEKAEEAVTKKETRFDSRVPGSFEAHHICFEGDHIIVEYEIDAWHPLGNF